MKVLTYAMIAVCAFGSSLQASDFEVMVLGDSIAAGLHGTPGRPSWRQELFDILDSGVIPSPHTGAKFIGPSAYEQGSDLLKHAAFRGAHANDLKNAYTGSPTNDPFGGSQLGILGWGNSSNYSPDLIIIQVGINDVLELQVEDEEDMDYLTWTSAKATTFFARLNGLVNQANSSHTSTTIAVCNLTNVDEGTWDEDQVESINEAVDDINSTMSTKLSGNADFIIDINAVVDPETETMANDGVHPNAYGLEDIGYKIYSVTKDWYGW